MTDHDHIILNLRTGEFECKHCGATQQVTTPAPISDFTVASNAFIAAHANCQQRGETLAKRHDNSDFRTF